MVNTRILKCCPKKSEDNLALNIKNRKCILFDELFINHYPRMIHRFHY